LPHTPDIESYIGIPFVEKGRSREGCDCYGLLCLVYRDLLGVVLPAFMNGYVSTQDSEELARLIRGHLEPWGRIEAGTEEPFDGVLMTEGGVPRHMGIVTRKGWLLHVENGGESLIERYDSFRLKRRVAGFYRHESQV
jgi:cell wall-associated NlpC family hydrolase